jgi:cytochrome bd-type quinol oxidase subunit 1
MTFFDTKNSARNQTTHTNSFFKLFFTLDFEISSQSSFFNDETKTKNSTKRINKMSKSSRWLTQFSCFFFSIMMMIMMMIIIIIIIIIIDVNKRISKALLKFSFFSSFFHRRRIDSSRLILLFSRRFRRNFSINSKTRSSESSRRD